MFAADFENWRKRSEEFDAAITNFGTVVKDSQTQNELPFVLSDITVSESRDDSFPDRIRTWDLGFLESSRKCPFVRRTRVEKMHTKNSITA